LRPLERSVAGSPCDISTLVQAEQGPQPALRTVVETFRRQRQHRQESTDEHDEGGPAIPFCEPFHMRTRETDECEAHEIVRCHPGPVSIPACEQGQEDAEPDPTERDGPRARVADEEE